MLEVLLLITKKWPLKLSYPGSDHNTLLDVYKFSQ